MFDLPTELIIDDEPHRIRNRGDFRMVLDCFNALQDAELEQFERVLAALVIFYDELNDAADIDRIWPEEEQVTEAIKAMFDFFSCGENTAGLQTSYKLVDWQKDQQMIASAVNNVAGKEVRQESYLHWWTFMGYYSAVGECPFSTVVQIRYKLAKGEKLEKYEQKFQRENPQYFNMDFRTVGQEEADQWGRNLWNADKQEGGD